MSLLGWGLGKVRYKEMYQRKKVDVEEALSHIKSNDEIVCGLIACEPATL